MRIVVIGGAGTAGKAVVKSSQEQGHEVLAVSRRTGVDVIARTGLADAVTGADAVIDVSSVVTLSARRASAFFSVSSSNILAAAEGAGVPHVVRLSIIGVDRNPHGFYAGQRAMEQIYEASSVPTTILRAAQFHEFAAQTLARASVGPVTLAPRARVQPVAGQEVGERLVQLAEGPPLGWARELAGPREEDLAEMVRGYARRAGRRGPLVPVRLPTGMMRGMQRGLNLPGEHSDLGVQTFAEWLTQQPGR